MQSFLPIQTMNLALLTVCPEAIIETVQHGPITVHDQGRAVAILISAEHFRDLLNRIDDLELASVIHSRRREIGFPVEIDEL